MVAQVTPGELGSVLHALKFAEDLVKEWLIKYKFKKWNVTETRKIPVPEETKKKRAEEIAKELTKHPKWRSHGRSIKIDDLEAIGLKITRIDNDPKLAEIVYRIQTVCRILFESTSTFKIFATQESKIFRLGTQVGVPVRVPERPKLNVVEIEQKCPKCGGIHRLYAKLVPDQMIDVDFKKRGFTPFPKDAKIICGCGFEIDLLGIKSQIEVQTEKEIILS